VWHAILAALHRWRGLPHASRHQAEGGDPRADIHTARPGSVPGQGRLGGTPGDHDHAAAGNGLAGRLLCQGHDRPQQRHGRPGQTADAISRQLREQLPDAGVGGVACPKGIKLAEGVTFQCTADVTGGQLPVTVTLSQVNTSTGEYDYNLKWAKAVIDTNKVVEEIQSRLPVQAANATVDCGTPRVRVVEVEGTIECTVSLGSKRRVVRAVVENVDGTVHFEPATVWPVTPPKVVTARIGDKLTVYDEAGDAQLEVTVTRLKFSTGDQFDRPQHGLYMGAYVQAKALADGQDLIDIYAIVSGHNYNGDAIIGSTAFDPSLDPVPLNTGERTSGWLVFDVPARHGQLVLRDLDGHKVGAWKY
jgi:Domain of unknown function (DUF4333)